MRVGIVSDVHGDVHRLLQAFRRIDRIGVDIVVCAGDLVGLFSDEVVQILEGRGVETTRGNHDEWTLNGNVLGGGWEISSVSRRFLSGLPTSVRIPVGRGHFAMTHASPGSTMVGIAPERLDLGAARTQLARASASILVVGHTHHAFAVDVAGGGLIVNPGALAGPDGGSFGILDSEERAFTVHRVDNGEELEVFRLLLSP